MPHSKMMVVMAAPSIAIAKNLQEIQCAKAWCSSGQLCCSQRSSRSARHIVQDVHDCIVQVERGQCGSLHGPGTHLKSEAPTRMPSNWYTSALMGSMPIARGSSAEIWPCTSASVEKMLGSQGAAVPKMTAKPIPRAAPSWSSLSVRSRASAELLCGQAHQRLMMENALAHRQAHQTWSAVLAGAAGTSDRSEATPRVAFCGET